MRSPFCLVPVDVMACVNGPLSPLATAQSASPGTRITPAGYAGVRRGTLTLPACSRQEIDLHSASDVEAVQMTSFA